MGLFDWLSRQTETKNQFNAQNFGDSSHFNGNAFQYGGAPGGAAAAAGRAQRLGDEARNVGGAYQNAAFGLYGQGNGQMDASMQARQQQQQVAGLMMNRATGAAPSIAQMQADRQMQQAAAAQQSAAASARGPAGLALAQGNAAANTAQAQQAISGQAQQAAAQERLAAEQAAMGAYSGIRSGDVQGANTAYGAAGQFGNLGLGYGNLGMQGEQLAHQVNTTQLGAQGNKMGLLAQSHAQGQQIGSGVAGANAGTNMQLFGAALGAGEGAAGGIANLAKAASGGPLTPGQPTLVGEEGPEIVLPMGGGHVLNTPQTMGLLGATTGAGANPMSGPAAPDFGGKGGLMGGDAMGELKRHQAYGTRFVRSPMSYGGG